LFAVLILGMLVPRANTVGAISAFAAGLAVFAVIRLWIPSLDDEALARLGVFAGLKSNTWWDSMFTTIPAFSVGAIVSCFTAPPTKEQLDGLLLCRPSDRKFGPSST
jgi:Na+/proline symporter